MKSRTEGELKWRQKKGERARGRERKTQRNAMQQKIVMDAWRIQRTRTHKQTHTKRE
jgi:hypothetical protein